MAKDYAKMACQIIEKVGGRDNIQTVTHCITRLRFVLKDESKADVEAVNQVEGVIKVLRSGGQFQVVIGTHVTDVFKVITDQNLAPVVGSDAASEEKKKFSVLDVIGSVFMPAMGGMMATGLLKGLLVMLTTLGVLSTESDVYTVLYAAGDAFLYFLPLALSITAARKFGCNQFVAFAVVATLLYPNLATAMAAEGGLSFFGLPITNVTYSTSVIPPIVAVLVLAQLEKLLNKLIPELVRGIFVPLLCLLIMAPLTLVVIGPAMIWIGEVVASVYLFVYGLNPAIAGTIMAFLWPLLVVMGAHMATFPIAINNMLVNGYDTMLPVTTGTNYAMAGAALAVALKTRNQKLKQLGYTTFISAIVGGVIEPAIYGIVLKYKKPFYIAMVMTGIGGLMAGIAGSQFTMMLTTCVLTLPAMGMFPGGWGFIAASVIGFVGTGVCTYLFGFDDSMLEAADS